MNSLYFLVAIYLLLLVETGFTKVVTTSANFLKIGDGAKVMAMANAGSSLACDASAFYWNPSASVFLQKPDLQTSYLNQLDEIHLSQIGLTKPFKRSSFGFSGRVIFTLDVEGRDALDRPTENFSFYNGSFAINHARMISKNSSAGISTKIIREAIGSHISNGVAFDLGWMGRKRGWIHSENLTYFAIVLQNVGPHFGDGKSSPLPSNGRLGISSSPFTKRWITAVDAIIPFQDDIELNFGNEWQVHSDFFLRAGYRFFHGDSRNRDWFKSLTGGFGFHFTPLSGGQRYNLDYAISTFGTVGFNHSFSFGIKFLK